MKITLLSLAFCASLSCSIFATQDSPGTMILDAKTLGPVTYTQWVDGAESEVINRDGHGIPQLLNYLWGRRRRSPGVCSTAIPRRPVPGICGSDFAIP